MGPTDQSAGQSSASTEDSSHLSEDIRLAEAEADDASLSAFEFNPSAPEFVPLQPSSPWPQDHAVNSELLEEVFLQASNIAPQSGTRRRARQRAGTAPVDFVSTAPDEERSGLIRPRPVGPRRSTSSVEAPGQVSTLVVKNLALDLPKGTIVKHLEDQGVGPSEVEFHYDSNGAFRGTAFVRYSSPSKAKAALDQLGVCPELGGRKARVEIQKSKTLIGRRCLEAELPQEELVAVREEIEQFLRDDQRWEVRLSPDLNVQQRKYAHSLAERHSLVHVTRQGSTGEKYVHLSKERRLQEGATRNKAHSFHTCPSPAAAPILPPGLIGGEELSVLAAAGLNFEDLAAAVAAATGVAVSNSRSKIKKKAQSTSFTHQSTPTLAADAVAYLEGAPGLPPPALTLSRLSSPMLPPALLPPAPGLHSPVLGVPLAPGLAPPGLELPVAAVTLADGYAADCS